MLERRRGHLLFISSIAGKTTVPGNPLYHATKFGLRGFAAALREDLHGSGVGGSCVFPGFIRDAGIFADSGVKLPPGVGTRSPEDVADGVGRGDRARPRRGRRGGLPPAGGRAWSRLAPDLVGGLRAPHRRRADRRRNGRRAARQTLSAARALRRGSAEAR